VGFIIYWKNCLVVRKSASTLKLKEKSAVAILKRKKTDHNFNFAGLVQEAMEGTRSQYKITIPLPVVLTSGKTWAQVS
jgi:hypothetical protein